MPIRLNLLAEAQALEEQRRRDPVKRAIWIAVLLIALTLAWASSLQLKAMVSNKELNRILADMNTCTNDYKQVVDMQKKVGDINQRLNALNILSTNRFLNGTLLGALQHTSVEDVQLIHLKVDQSYAFNEGTKPKTNGSNVIPGAPPTVGEKITLTLEGIDASPSPGDQVSKVKETIANNPYFLERLDKTNAVSWKNSSSPQLSPETGRAIVNFTLECHYPEKLR